MSIPTGTDLRREILRETEACVCKNRQDTYGDAEDNFANIAAMLNIRLQNKLSQPLTADDVAAIMVVVKLCRQIQSPDYLDNWIDLIGYGVCGGGIVKRKQLKTHADTTPSN